MTREYDKSERYREGGEIINCRHCNGKGRTTYSCCQKRVGLSGGAVAPCCVCGGKGVVRV